MILDLSLDVLILDLGLSLLLSDEAVVRPTSNGLSNWLRLVCPLELALLRVKRSSHLNGLLVERIGVSIDSVKIRLLHL